MQEKRVFCTSAYLRNQTRVTSLPPSLRLVCRFLLHHSLYASLIQSVGFNVESVQYKRVTFTCFDIGMGDWATSRRYAHREFYPSCVGCIFMLDSHAEDWFPDVREHLIRLFDHGEFGLPAGVPVVVLANKQDLQVSSGTCWLKLNVVH